jgi:hypothetical protein
LPLSPEIQVHLLREAEANRWPVRRLEEAIITTNETRVNRGGRRRQSRLRRATNVLDRDISAVTEAFDELEDSSGGASPESTRRALEVLRRTAEVCTSYEERILRRVAPGVAQGRVERVK